eukprot:2922235-Prymnesium_polylepis.1
MPTAVPDRARRARTARSAAAAGREGRSTPLTLRASVRHWPGRRRCPHRPRRRASAARGAAGRARSPPAARQTRTARRQ